MQALSVRRAQRDDLGIPLQYAVRFIRNTAGEPIIDRSYNLIQLLGAYGTRIQVPLCHCPPPPPPPGSWACTHQTFRLASSSSRTRNCVGMRDEKLCRDTCRNRYRLPILLATGAGYAHWSGA